MEESSPWFFRCMDTAYGYGSFPTPKIAENKVTSHPMGINGKFDHPTQPISDIQVLV